jgi:TPR repeat protein
MQKQPSENEAEVHFLKTKELAESGHPLAQHNLGALYAHGKGVKESYEQAMHWYKKAAENEDADAMFMIGVMYANGQGVAVDIDAAKYWWEKAAVKDHPKAMFFLGRIYETGDGKWSVSITDGGRRVNLQGITLDQLTGLPED